MKTKDKILRVAFKLFLKKGFTDVSINEIIIKSQIAKGSFYYYFKNKNQLLNEVIDKYILSFIDNLTLTMQDFPGNSEDKIKFFFETLIDVEDGLRKTVGDKSITYRSFYLLLLEGIKKFDILNERMLSHYNRLRQVITNIIDEGKEEGLINKSIESDSVAQHIIASCEGILLLWVITNQIDLRNHSLEMFDNFWEILKA